MIYQTPTLTPEIWRAHDKIDELRKQLSYSVHSRRWTGYLARVMFGRGIQGSNSIEGYNVTVDDAVAAVDGDQPSDLSPEQETWAAITGYRDAMTYVLRLADDPHFDHSTTLVRSLHYMMQKYDGTKHPGQWRPGPIFIRNDATGERVYCAPNAEEVPDLMSALTQSLNSAPAETPIMVRAAMAHLNLVMIHPFSDGNGRMARCLQTLVLAREGILAPQFCSIEEYLGKYRQDYYNVLAEVGQGDWHPHNDATAWVRFCLTIHFRQATTILRRNRELSRLWEVLTRITDELHLPERMVTLLADAALGFRVRNATYRSQAEISMNQASTDFNRLVTAGYIKAAGGKRTRHYVATDRLRMIREEIREPAQDVEDPFSGSATRLDPKSGQQWLPGFWLDET